MKFKFYCDCVYRITLGLEKKSCILSAAVRRLVETDIYYIHCFINLLSNESSQLSSCSQKIHSVFLFGKFQEVVVILSKTIEELRHS